MEGSPTTSSVSFTVPPSAVLKRAPASPFAAVGVAAAVGWTVDVALRSSR